jgi:hypothetical protein
MRSETKRWTTEEDDILRQAALAGTSVAEIASTVGRTESAVRARAYVLRVLPRPVGIRRRGSVWQSSGARASKQHSDSDLCIDLVGEGNGRLGARQTT